MVGILNGKINFLEVYVFLRRHGFEMKKKRFCEKSSEGLVILVTIQMYWIICFVYKEILCFNVSNGSYHVFFSLLFNLAPKTIYLVYAMLFVLYTWKPDVFVLKE